MKKRRGLYESSEKTITQEIVKTNLIKCLREVSLNDNYSHRNVIKITKDMICVFFNKDEEYIPIKNYIQFLKEIPSVFWADYPVMYYRDNKWDALGLLGERVHKSTIRTKYLQICFETVGLNIARVLDNEVEMFYKYKTEKKRFLAALYYILEKLQEEDLIKILTRANKLSDEKKKINIK